MSALDRVLIAVVTSGAPWVEAHVEALRSAGARVRICKPDRSLWSILTALDYDAIVVADVEPGAAAIARALSEDARLRTVPAVALCAPGTHEDVEVGITTIDSDAPGDTLQAVEALVDGHALRRGATSPSISPPSFRSVIPPPSLIPPPSMIPPPNESPARRELEAGFHDLRVLLGAILGYGANLRDGADGPLSEAQGEHVLKMMEAAHDATLLLEHTMAASRSAALGVPATRSLGTKRTLVDLTALAQSVVRMFARAAQQRSIDMAFIGAEPIRLWGNAVHLKQVLANLVVNALKFAPPGGRVRVSVRAGVGADAEIVVSDNGPGVPVADRERIFDHGVRLERDVGIGGTGIGLAVVRELVVVHHGGTVRVGGDAGGAEFIVSLPFDRRSRPREAPTSTRESPEAGPRAAGVR